VKAGRSANNPRLLTNARAAATLLRRLESTHAAYAAVRDALPDVAGAGDVVTAYELTHHAVQQFIVTTHTEWFATVDPGLAKALQAPLLVQDRADRERQRLLGGDRAVLRPRGMSQQWSAHRSRPRHLFPSQHCTVCHVQQLSCANTPKPPTPRAIQQTPGGLLSVNFAPQLLSMSAEVVQWERLRLSVPYAAMEIQAQRDKYRALRGHVLALVGAWGFGRRGWAWQHQVPCGALLPFGVLLIPRCQ
jgi:hypothetical protein